MSRTERIDLWGAWDHQPGKWDLVYTAYQPANDPPLSDGEMLNEAWSSALKAGCTCTKFDLRIGEAGKPGLRILRAYLLHTPGCPAEPGPMHCRCIPTYRLQRFRDGKLETINVDDPTAVMQEAKRGVALDVLHEPWCP